MNPKYTIKFNKGKVTHNIPTELDEDDFRYLLGVLSLEVICRNHNKNFSVTIETESDGQICGGYSDPIPKPIYRYKEEIPQCLT